MIQNAFVHFRLHVSIQSLKFPLKRDLRFRFVRINEWRTGAVFDARD